MSESIVTRGGTPQDAEAIAALYFQERITDTRIQSVATALANFPSKVAEHDGMPVGFVYCGSFAPDILETRNIFIEREHRGKGIGSVLLRGIETRLPNGINGMVTVNSDLYSGSEQAASGVIHFYERNGFEVIGQTPASRIFLKNL